MDYKSTNVASIMSTDVVSAKLTDTIDKIEESMLEHRIQHMPIVNANGGVAGIISKDDIALLKDWGVRLGLKRSISKSERLMEGNTADDLMTTDVVIVSPATTLSECAKLMKELFCHALPVEKDGKLVGIISTYDLIKIVYL